MINLFENKTPAGKQNKEYHMLSTCSGYSPAKSLIEEISQSFSDKDGNFVEQFQSTSFYQRLWELFLSELLKEFKLVDISVKQAPDFHLQKNGVDFFLEATSSNPADKDEFTDDYIEKALKEKDLKVQKDLIDYYTIKVGSTLKSKLDKKYWELDWVAGKPLVIGIKPSHNKFANWFPDYKIIEYLYGAGTKNAKNEEGNKVIENSVLEEHSYKNKKIPSNFFTQPDTENISAVIWANTCDLHKFNRMAFQGKYKTDNIIIYRAGKCAGQGSVGQDFMYMVGDSNYKETWAEGVSIFHNPNAKYPLDKSLFSEVRQMWINENNEFDELMPKFYPFVSHTEFMEKPKP